MKANDDSDCDSAFSSDEGEFDYESDMEVSDNDDDDDKSSASIQSSTLAMDDGEAKSRITRKADAPDENETANSRFNSTQGVRTNASDGRPDQVKVGRRVEVYWSGDEEYYPGVVARRGKGDKIFIEYDDGDSEWRRLNDRVKALSAEDDLLLREATLTAC
jgi:hypothetical protein